MRTKNQKDEEISIQMWEQGREDSQHTYMFQLQSRSQVLLRKAEKLLSGLKAGSGYDRNKKEGIVLVRKCFSSCLELETFIDGFEFNVRRI